MAWRHPGNKPQSEPKLVTLLTHICVTRPVNELTHKRHPIARPSGRAMGCLLCAKMSIVNILIKHPVLYGSRLGGIPYFSFALFHTKPICFSTWPWSWNHLKWIIQHPWILLTNSSWALQQNLMKTHFFLQIWSFYNTLKSPQMTRQFIDNIFKWTFLEFFTRVLIKMPLQFVHRYYMKWWWPSSLTCIWVIKTQCANQRNFWVEACWALNEKFGKFNLL